MKRLIAENVFLTEKANTNKNELVIGSSGCGKSGGYVVPLILSAEESFVVADTKKSLYSKFKRYLEKRGYKVYNLNLVEPSLGCGWDPLDYIRYKTDKKGRKVFDQKDIITLASQICPVLPTDREPFWTQQAQFLISILISYVLDEFNGADKNLSSILDVFRYMADCMEDNAVPFMDDYCIKRPNSFAAKRYQMISSSFNADRTWSSIKFITANALQIFEFDSAKKMLTRKKRFDIRMLGKEKTALFLNISDTDRSLDMLAGIFYSQALNVLCEEADRNPTSKLDVPVKLCLDDFASNAFISDFEKMMSVVRSRDISISCIVQSLSQLNTYYGEARASTIIDNADLLYYMGCQDLLSANFISARANMPLENVLALKNNEGILFRRGEKPLKVNKIPPYSMMPKDDDEQYDFGDDEPQTEQTAPQGTAL